MLRYFNLVIVYAILLSRQIESNTLRLTCSEEEVRMIHGEANKVIDTYCRCSDLSYGLTCEERYANPCFMIKQFGISPKTIPDNYFVHCENRVPHLFKCPTYLIWNDKLQTCSYAEGYHSAMQIKYKDMLNQQIKKQEILNRKLIQPKDTFLSIMDLNDLVEKITDDLPLTNKEHLMIEKINKQKSQLTKEELINQQQSSVNSGVQTMIYNYVNDRINQKQKLTNEEQVMINKINSKETLKNNGKKILVQGRFNNGNQMIAQNNMAGRINEQKLPLKNREKILIEKTKQDIMTGRINNDLQMIVQNNMASSINQQKSTGTKHEQIMGQINIDSSVNSQKSSSFNGEINLPKLPILNVNQKSSQTGSKNQIKSDMSYLEKFIATYSKDPLFSELDNFKSLTPQIVFTQIETKSNADAIIKQDVDCNSKTIYTVSMPRSLSKTDSLKSFDLIRHSLREKASEGIDILLKFPRD